MLETQGTLERVGTQTDILGECPLWDDLTQCLYWVDIRRPAIRRLRYASGEVDSWPMPDLVGSIALVDDGRLLVALPQQIALFDPGSEQLTPFVPSLTMPEGHRFNDGRCDARGRFWVGSMHNITRAPEGTLFCLEGAGPLRPVRNGICIPNSLAFSPDGATLYFVSDRGGSPQIYRVPVAGGGAQRVTFSGPYNISPAISPDGRTLAYISRQGGAYRLVAQDVAPPFLKCGDQCGAKSSALPRLPQLLNYRRRCVHPNLPSSFANEQLDVILEDVQRNC